MGARAPYSMRGEPVTTIIVRLAVTVIFAGVVWLNVLHHRRRARMTPDQRREEDDAANEHINSW